MPRGFVYATYTADDGDTFQTLVDADEVLDANRGWGAAIVGNDLLPQRLRTRRVIGTSPTTGMRGVARIGSLTAALWTGAANTFTVEANDGTTDTCTVVDRQEERRRLAS